MKRKRLIKGTLIATGLILMGLCSFYFQVKTNVPSIKNVSVIVVLSGIWGYVTVTTLFLLQIPLRKYLKSFSIFLEFPAALACFYFGWFIFPLALYKVWKDTIISNKYLNYAFLSGLGVSLLWTFFLGATVFGFFFSQQGNPQHINSVQTYELPLEYTNSSHLKVWCEIEGKSYPFILDTGASNIIFMDADDPLHKQAGVGLKWFSVGLDATSHLFFTWIYEVEEFKMSGLTFNNFKFDGVRFKPNHCDSDIKGIIGKDLMKHFTWYFNSSDRRIVIANNIESLSLDQVFDTLNVSINRNSHHIRLRLKVDNSVKEPFILDTGYNGGIGLSANPESIGGEDKVRVIGNAGRSLSNKSDELHRYKIPLVKTSEENFVLARNVAGYISPGRANLLGNKILKRWDYVLDYHNKQVLIRKDSSRSISMNPRGYGLTFDVSDSMDVLLSSVDEDVYVSSGIEPGWKVSALNDHEINADNYCELVSAAFRKDTMKITFLEHPEAISLKKRYLFNSY